MAMTHSNHHPVLRNLNNRSQRHPTKIHFLFFKILKIFKIYFPVPFFKRKRGNESGFLLFSFLRAFVSVFQGQPQNPPHPSRGTTPTVPTQLQHTAAPCRLQYFASVLFTFHAHTYTQEKERKWRELFSFFPKQKPKKKERKPSNVGAWWPH